MCRIDCRSALSGNRTLFSDLARRRDPYRVGAAGCVLGGRHPYAEIAQAQGTAREGKGQVAQASGGGRERENPGKASASLGGSVTSYL